MRIVVCVKHVPDIQSDRQLTEAGRVDRSGEMVLNELDENAIEQALETVESLGGKDHEVIAVTVGPKEAAVAVRKALQLGAHRGVHVSDDAIAGSDVFATAKVLEGTIRAIDRRSEERRVGKECRSGWWEEDEKEEEEKEGEAKR